MKTVQHDRLVDQHLTDAGTDRVLAAIAATPHQPARALVGAVVEAHPFDGAQCPDADGVGGVEAIDSVNPSVTGRALGMVRLRIGIAKAEFAVGKVPFRRVEQRVEALERIASRITDEARRERKALEELYPDFLARIGRTEDRVAGPALPNPYGSKAIGYRSAARIAQFIGVPADDKLPLVSIGPSGIGGDCQTEIDAALAPAGRTCEECDSTITEESKCIRCAMNEGADHD